MSGSLLRRLVVASAALCAATVPAMAAEPPIRHVFIVVLENESYDTTFGPNSPAPYLAHMLPQQGALLTNYYGIGHASLDNYIAMISGQPPNEETQRDCGTFSEFALRQPGLDAQGRAIGKGCVYPSFVKTLPDQLEAHGFTWRAYMEDMGSNPSREASTCAHVAIGAHDGTNHATVGDQYADKHNPFVYFHSIIDNQARCDAHVVNLNLLQADLADASRTPNFVYITPNLCNDGHDAPCVDGKPGGLVSANAFLEHWIPVIRNSPAFQKDGLLIVTFDEAGSEGPHDSDACCGELPMPGAAFPPGGNGPGGGRIGAVLLSPHIKPGTVSDKPYNHDAMLRSIDDIFGMPHLALAGAADVNSFGPEIFAH
jgi:hypothetical protein